MLSAKAIAGVQWVRYLLLSGSEQGFPTLDTAALGKVADSLVNALGVPGYPASSVTVTLVQSGRRRLQQTTTRDALLRVEFTDLNSHMAEAQLDQKLQSEAFMTQLAANLQATGVTSSGPAPLQVGVSDANRSTPSTMYPIGQQGRESRLCAYV